MSYLLFMDESGHDHKNTPYEVRGGIAIPDNELWSFVQGMQNLENLSFGDRLYNYGKEIKGHKLLDKDRFKWSNQDEWFEDSLRRKLALAFLNRGLKKEKPHRNEFTAYGQACLTMIRGIFKLLDQHRAVIFASVIPSNSTKPAGFKFDDYLRKDHVFLFERYFDFLDQNETQGLLVLDETDKSEDRRFVEKMNRYFLKTRTGILRSTRIIPVPFFVASDMSYLIQAADCVIYCINWGFRLTVSGMNAEARVDIVNESYDWIRRLQARIEINKNGYCGCEWGITYVPDPYMGRA